jgi:hypothetical protein
MTSEATEAWESTNWTQTCLKSALDAGLKATGQLTLTGAVGKPP